MLKKEKACCYAFLNKMSFACRFPGMKFFFISCHHRMLPLHTCLIYCFVNSVTVLLFSGNYKVQAYDQNVKDYMPVSPGIGMHVEVRDPADKIVLSRVSCLQFKLVYIHCR